MAENKKSFVLYTDLIHTVRKMKDAHAGQLLKTILAYVNDENPNVENPIVDLVFEPIKRQMKRDLTKWESELKRKSEAGKKGMESRWGKKAEIITEHNSVIPVITEITDNVTVTVTDTVNVTDTSSFKKEAKSANEILENQESSQELKSEPQKRKKVAPKKEKEEPPEIPTMQAFTAYGKQNAPDVSEQALELKYKAWTENGWKTGKGAKIINWKSTLLNTISFLPKNNYTTNEHQQKTTATTGNIKPKTIGGMRAAEVEEFVRRQLQRAAADNGEQESGSS